MITLGSIQFRNGMVWEEQSQYTGIIQAVRQTLGGRSHVYTRSGAGPMAITLSSLDDQGVQDYSVAQAIEALSKDPAGSYTLQLGPRQFQVSFRHWEPPVITLTPIIERTTLLSDDLVRMTIKLVCYNP